MSQQSYYTHCSPHHHKKRDKCCACNARVGNVTQIAIAIASNGNAEASNDSVNVVVNNDVCTKEKNIGFGPLASNTAGVSNPSGVTTLDASNGLDLRITPDGEIYLNGQVMELNEVADGVKTLKVES